VTLLLLITGTALTLGYIAGWVDHRREHRPETRSEWWAGWEVGRDMAMRARSVGARTDHEQERAEQ
jgi:hypothetical protein